eukprot:scaffold118352_cov29-Prasinocladus_malaysianus.AAC.3
MASYIMEVCIRELGPEFLCNGSPVGISFRSDEKFVMYAGRRACWKRRDGRVARGGLLAAVHATCGPDGAD